MKQEATVANFVEPIADTIVTECCPSSAERYTVPGNHLPNTSRH